MGFEEECFGENVDEMIDLALKSDDPWMEGMSRERLERGQVRMNFPASGVGQPASGEQGDERSGAARKRLRFFLLRRVISELLPGRRSFTTKG